MGWLDWMQWPAMIATVTATWLIASTSRRRRNLGFWLSLASNALWIVWGWHDGAMAVIALQIALAALNVRGVRNNDPDGPDPCGPRGSRG